MNKQPFGLKTAGDSGFKGTDLRLLHGDGLQVTSNHSGWGLGANEVLEVGYRFDFYRVVLVGSKTWRSVHQRRVFEIQSALGAQASRIRGHKRHRNR